MARPKADTRGAKRAPLPTRSPIVRKLNDRQLKAIEGDDSLMARRQQARRPVEYGPTVTLLVQDESGRRQLVEGRLSELRRAFPDEAEMVERQRAGIEGGMVPVAIVEMHGTPEVEAAAAAIKRTGHTISSALVAGAIDGFLARELRQRRKEFGIS